MVDDVPIGEPARKVSVVVAVYNTGDRINGLVSSLVAQTMPASDFEVIFVDDGSTDGSGDRLRDLAARTVDPRLVVRSIPNSGWPGRPRNVGLDLAAGEFVLFMDHDDELYPEALERMYRYAVDNGADVIIGKEVRAGAKTLGLGLFRRNIADADLLRDGVLSLLTPHKMFRTAFLRAHGIRFPEGRRRLEDHNHLAQVYTANPHISVLAEYPTYRWIIHNDGTNNSSVSPEPEGYYGNVREVLDIIEANVAEGSRRDSLIGHWYRGKTLDLLGPGVFGRSERAYQNEFFRVARQLVLDRFPERLDAKLNPVHRIRARYLRAGDLEGLLRFVESERHVTAPVLQVRHEWKDGVLVVEATSRLESSGEPVRYRRVGDRLLRAPAIDLGPLITSDDLDVTSSLPGMRTEMTIRQRAAGDEWFLPSTGGVTLVDEADGTVSLHGKVTARIDPSTAVFGRRLADGIWDLTMRTLAVGYDARPRVVAAADVLPGLIDGMLVIPYPTKNAKYSIDVGQRVRTVIGSARPRAGDVTVSPASAPGPAPAQLDVALPRVASRGDQPVTGLVWLAEHSAPATLVPGDPPRLRAEVDVLPGRQVLEHEFAGRRGNTGLELVKDARGEIRVSAATRRAAVPAEGDREPEPEPRDKADPGDLTYRLYSALKSVPGLRTAVRAGRRIHARRSARRPGARR